MSSNNKDKTIERMKVLTEMLFEAHEKAKNEPEWFSNSQARGSVGHLACEIGKLCSELRR